MDAQPTAPPTTPSTPPHSAADAMPELPEVEVVRAGLERHVLGATITRSRCCTRARYAATRAAGRLRRRR